MVVVVVVVVVKGRIFAPQTVRHMLLEAETEGRVKVQAQLRRDLRGREVLPGLAGLYTGTQAAQGALTETPVQPVWELAVPLAVLLARRVQRVPVERMSRVTET